MSSSQKQIDYILELLDVIKGYLSKDSAVISTDFIDEPEALLIEKYQQKLFQASKGLLEIDLSKLRTIDVPSLFYERSRLETKVIEMLEKVTKEALSHSNSEKTINSIEKCLRRLIGISGDTLSFIQKHSNHIKPTDADSWAQEYESLLDIDTKEIEKDTLLFQRMAEKYGIEYPNFTDEVESDG